MDIEKLNVRTLDDFVKLPWFEKDEIGLRLKKDAGLPPIIDVHTHLGYSYFFSRWIDLNKKTDVTYFYDYNTPQDVLFGKDHPTDAERKAMTNDINFIIVRRPAMGMTHTLPNITDEMDRFGFRHCVSLPIEIPLRSRHAHHVLSTCRGQDRVIPFAAVHPWAHNPRKRLEWFISQGCRGLKFHPEFQFHPPDSRLAMRIFGFCEEMNVVVLAHTGSTGVEPAWMRKMSDLPRFRPIMERFPNLKIVLGHTGIRFVDEAIAYSREFPNVYLEISGQPVNTIKKIIAEADNDRILFGTDWPFYPLAVELGCLLVATEGNDVVRNKILHDNAARLLKLDV